MEGGQLLCFRIGNACRADLDADYSALQISKRRESTFETAPTWLEWARDFKMDDKKSVFRPFGPEFDMEDGIEAFNNYYEGYRGE